MKDNNKLERELALENIPENVNVEFLNKYNFQHSLNIHSDNEVYENHKITMVIRASPVGEGYNVGAKWNKK